MEAETSSKVIAYVVVCYNAKFSGVFNKVSDQVSHWKSRGYSFQLFVITDLESRDSWLEIDQNAVILVDRSHLSKIRNRWRVVGLAVQTNPSLVYIRDSFPIKLLKTSIPLIIEVQSRVGLEIKMRSRLKFFFFQLMKQRIYSKISAAVYVSNELCELNEFEIKENIPRITISNGISLDRIETLPTRDNSNLAILFVGHPNQAWHGVPELVEFAKLHSEIEFHIVGSKSHNSLPNVNYYGEMRSHEYRRIAEKCTAGMGSLQLSINQMNEASPLKVREYLALGLPVILKYRDTDLDPSLDFVLQLPSNNQSLVEYSDEIISFLTVWAKKRVPRSQILNLDAGRKEEIRLDFFESILGNSQKG